VGDVFQNFSVFQKFEIPERRWTVYRLKHENTGAEYCHIYAPDPENTFGVILKTLPSDSTGVAHILEHTTLCGSEKYPVRDPFTNMLSRSLNTYMNAWTGSDFTGYPFSTQNEQDFKNLLSVYLDAVFFPKLEELDFHQEGHRLEFVNPDDLNSALSIKGVVYNEMKGAMANTDRQIYQNLQTSLYPGTTYQYNSGGDPMEIPKLTYQDLVNFHHVFYHPSNARFFSYGDIRLENTLDFVEKHSLSKFQKIEIDTDIKPVRRFAEPQLISMNCSLRPGSDPQNDLSVIVSYLANDIKDVFETFSMNILSILLLDGEASPMYKARMERNQIGKEFTLTGYSHSSAESLFGVGLQGVTEDQISTVFEMVRSTLEKVRNEGFSEERIESVLHRVELSQKHTPSNIGLNLFGDLIPGWIHGADLKNMLDINECVKKFRETLKENPKYLESLIDKHLLSNPHQVKLIARPDVKHLDKLNKEEEKLIGRITKSLNETQRKRIAELQKQLQIHQGLEQDPSVLPTLKVSDIPKEARKDQFQKDHVEGCSVQWNAQPTNGLLFFRVKFPVDHLPSELAPYVPLFTRLFARMTTPSRSYDELAQALENSTGGISSSFLCARNFSLPDWTETMDLQFKSYALERNIDKMFELFTEVFTSPMMGLDQFKSILQSTIAGMEGGLMDSPHSYAMKYSAKNVSLESKVSEQLSGIEYFNFLQSIADSETQYAHALQKINEIGEFIRSSKPSFSINANEELFPKARKGIQSFVKRLQTPGLDFSMHKLKDAFVLENKQEKVFIPTDLGVNFCALALPGVPMVHPDAAKLRVLGSLASLKYLHPEIREKGGAYGAGLMAGNTLQFYTYRDPNIERSLDAFRGLPQWIKTHSNYTEEEIEQAKLMLFQKLDAPVIPSRRGLDYFSQSITEEIRQAYRDQVFKTSRDDFVDIVDRYFNFQSESIAVIGNKASVLDSSWEISDVLKSE